MYEFDFYDGINRYYALWSLNPLFLISCCLALHLAASECPRIRAKDITLLLLIVGTDISIRSAEGKTAHQMALESNNTAVLSAYEEFNNVRHGRDPVLKAKFQKQFTILKTDYTFQITTKTRPAADPKNIKQHFEIPDFLLEDQDHVGNIPDELVIHEHHIKPLASVGFKEMTGTEALQCLEFTREQAIANLHRREQVMKSTGAHLNFKAADPKLYSI